MRNGVTTMERAYQLARSGECKGIVEIKKRLKQEGFHDAGAQLYGRFITSTLRRMCAEACAESGREEPPDGVTA